eukprot:Rmarinus@m.27665
MYRRLRIRYPGLSGPTLRSWRPYERIRSPCEQSSLACHANSVLTLKKKSPHRALSPALTSSSYLEPSISVCTLRGKPVSSFNKLLAKPSNKQNDPLRTANLASTTFETSLSTWITSVPSCSRGSHGTRVPPSWTPLTRSECLGALALARGGMVWHEMRRWRTQSVRPFANSCRWCRVASTTSCKNCKRPLETSSVLCKRRFSTGRKPFWAS